jgi:hypothetical protein
LLDEDLAHKLRQALIGHEVVTAQYMGWGGLRNGDLIAVAEAAGIEVLVTGDRNIEYQQNVAGRRIAIIILSAHNWPIIRNYLPKIKAAVDSAVPGSFRFVECGTFSRSRQPGVQK